MTLEEIKAAVDSGAVVCWKNNAYQVVKGASGYLVKCVLNGHCIGLTWADGVTMNGDPEDFYVKQGGA